MFNKLAQSMLHNLQNAYSKIVGPVVGSLKGVEHGSGSWDKYFNAIGKVESSNNYRAINRDSGALGRYQFMPYTLKDMGVNPNEFLNNPSLQDATMKKFTANNIAYANRMGFNINPNDGFDPRELDLASKMHYGGAGVVKNLRNQRAMNRLQAGNYPSLNGYSGNVQNAYNR